MKPQQKNKTSGDPLKSLQPWESVVLNTQLGAVVLAIVFLRAILGPFLLTDDEWSDMQAILTTSLTALTALVLLRAVYPAKGVLCRMVQKSSITILLLIDWRSFLRAAQRVNVGANSVGRGLVYVGTIAIATYLLDSRKL